MAAIAVISLAYYLPDIRRLWEPLGYFGFDTNDENIVVAVNRRYPAARSGIRVGDHLDVAATAPEYKMFANSAISAAGGQHAVFPFERGARKWNVELVSKSVRPLGVFNSIFLLCQELAVLLWLGIGAALVLLRPSPVTWAFYMCCTFFNSGPSAVALGSNYPWNMMAGIDFTLFAASGPVGAMVFAALFLHDPPAGWRRLIYTTAPVGWLLLFGLWLYHVLGGIWFGLPVAKIGYVIESLQIVLGLITVYALGDTYFRVRGSDKQRIRWLVVAFSTALIAFEAANLRNYISVPDWFVFLWLVPVIVPLSVAYAVTKHRVIDVRFAVSRAIVLTILTSLVVALFALIDWFFGRMLDRRDLGFGFGILAVMTFAFTAQALHRRIDTAVDKTFFRRRHLAEQRLARVARELLDVQAVQTFNAILVDEPLQAFGLTSAALFRRRELSTFERAEAVGWPNESLRTLDITVVPLSKFAKLTQTEQIDWEDPNNREFPSSEGRPVLAMPIVSNRVLQAIVFYGPHENGAAFDRDEIRSIDGMMIPAVAAFHRLEAESLRREVHAQHPDSPDVVTT